LILFSIFAVALAVEHHPGFAVAPAPPNPQL
jgi:hypothetical protein